MLEKLSLYDIARLSNVNLKVILLVVKKKYVCICTI